RRGRREARGVTAAAADSNSSRLPLPPNYYVTFQGVANYQPQSPLQSHSVMGFPQPAPPPGYSGSTLHYYPQGYQTVPGYAVYEGGRPFREERLTCCGVGIGWFLFITCFST
ncbi:60S ribosomal protein l18a-like protein, partial [Phtheirospermum japonicum]